MIRAYWGVICWKWNGEKEFVDCETWQAAENFRKAYLASHHAPALVARRP
jgi:hypothetical protein